MVDPASGQQCFSLACEAFRYAHLGCWAWPPHTSIYPHERASESEWVGEWTTLPHYIMAEEKALPEPPPKPRSRIVFGHLSREQMLRDPSKVLGGAQAQRHSWFQRTQESAVIV